MGKHKNATMPSGGMQRDTSPTPSSCGGKPGDTAQNLIEEVTSMEEVLLQKGTSPKTPFRFTQSKRLLSIWSLSPEHWWDHSTSPDEQMWYCIHVRVTLEDGRGGQPQPSSTWSGLLIAVMLQEACPRDQITKAVVLALGEEILFFGRFSCQEGLLYRNAKDVELSLRSLVN